MTAVLLATGVSFEKASKLAANMAVEKGMYDSWLGLVGTWGPVIREWLDILVCVRNIPLLPLSPSLDRA